MTAFLTLINQMSISKPITCMFIYTCMSNVSYCSCRVLAVIFVCLRVSNWHRSVAKGQLLKSGENYSKVVRNKRAV